MKMITSCIDTDREVLEHIPDFLLPKFFVLSKAFYWKVCDDNFLKSRLKKYRYFFNPQYKKEDETWKCFYLRAIYNIHVMKKDFGVEYRQGNFETQMKVLKRFKELNIILNSCSDSCSDSPSKLNFIIAIFKVLIIFFYLYRIAIYEKLT
jgi:hypothetical protein